MKLLLVLTEFPPRIGGMQTHALRLATALWARGHDVVVQTYRACTRIEQREGPRVDAALGFPVYRDLSRLSHERNLQLIADRVKSIAPDIVYSSTIFYGEVAGRCGIPVVARSVGNDVLRPWIVYPFRLFSGVVGASWFEGRIYRFFRSLEYPERIEAIWRGSRRARMMISAQYHSAILANSHFTVELLRDIGVEPQVVEQVTGGVDSESFVKASAAECVELRSEFGIGLNDWVMLTACRLVKKKGIDFLIESMTAVRERIPNAVLVIVGSGREQKKLRRLVTSHGLEQAVLFLGRIPHESVARLYSLADVFVLASRVWTDPVTGLRDAETMGRVLCEANAAGVPVVAASSGGIPSVIEHGQNGLLFTPDDADSLVHSLSRLYRDEELSRGMVQRGRKASIERFDWRHIVDAHVRVFDRVVKVQRGAA
ncbi:MAG: glycosyltransferase family 4 protein [Myxococcota bacterium]|nr:glycosyltransferase family 4 protein [Myxococcota bacterium]